MIKPELHFEAIPRILADLDPVSRKLLLDEIADNISSVALLVAIQLADAVGGNNPELVKHTTKRCEELGETTREVLNDMVEQVLAARKVN